MKVYAHLSVNGGAATSDALCVRGEPTTERHAGAWGHPFTTSTTEVTCPRCLEWMHA